jgi:hypothetical protein
MARADRHGDKCPPLVKCTMYFVTVCVPVNLEGGSDFDLLKIVLGNCKI